MPYVNLVFGNEDEAAAYAGSHSITPNDLETVALNIAHLPREDTSKPRVVVITHGAEATVLATSDSKEAKTYTVEKLPAGSVKDTNGAGDAFAGAFTAALIAGKSLDEAVAAGHKLGGICVGQGTSLFLFYIACGLMAYSWPYVRLKATYPLD